MTKPAPLPPERTPPQNIELEMCVLGGIMLEPQRAYSMAADILTKESFYLDGHGLIFELMGELYKRGIPPDSDMVLDELRGRNLLEKVGGAGVILKMLNSVASAANVYYHAKKISEKAHLRAIIRACTQVLEECYRGEMPVDEILAQIGDAAAQLSSSVHETRAEPIIDSMVILWEGLCERDDLVKEALAASRTPPSLFTGLPTGFTDLDKMLRGLRPQELTVIAGHVSEGKTALALAIVRHLAVSQELPVAVFSLEMNEATLSERVLSMGTKHWREGEIRGVPIGSFEVPNFDQETWNVLTQSFNSQAPAPIYWVCHPEMTVAKIAAELRQLKRRHGVRAAIIDYTQLITPSRKRDNRTVEVGDISRGLKRLVRSMNMPIVALSQLGRAYVGKFPELHQLRESGDIANDADNVVMLYRQDLHDKEYAKRLEEEVAQKRIDNPGQDIQAPLPSALLVVGKNRNGPTGIVTLRFFKELMLFMSATRS